MAKAASSWNKILLFSVHTNLETLFQIKNKVICYFTLVYIGKGVHTYQIIKCTCFSVKFGLKYSLALDLIFQLDCLIPGLYFKEYVKENGSEFSKT